jgi:hypothetical protein
MQTIQESDEFKHMQVDPVLHQVLHHDGLGYLSPAHQQQAPQECQPEPVQQQQVPVAKKRIVKKKSPVNPAPVVAAPDPVVAVVAVVAALPDPVVAVAPDPVVPDPVVAAAPDPVVPDPVGAVVEKRKVIRKKAPIPPIAIAMDMTTERNDPLTKPADAHTPPPNTQKKIIRKKS